MEAQGRGLDGNRERRRQNPEQLSRPDRLRPDEAPSPSRTCHPEQVRGREDEAKTVPNPF